MCYNKVVRRNYMSGGIIALIVISSVLVLALVLFFCLVPGKSYFTAMFSGAYVSARRLMLLRLRKMPVFDMVKAYIRAKKGKTSITMDDIENMFVTKCDYNQVVDGYIACRDAGINYKFETVKKINLSGKNVFDFVQEYLNARVVETPYISAICGDLQELNIKIKLTLKVDLKHIFSSLNVDTILARINEAVLAKVASTKDHRFILSTPQVLAKAIYEAETDNGNYYEIVSADAVEVNLGKNYVLAKEREEIEKKRIMTQNNLEERRLTAVAVEQEMKSRTEELKAQLVEEEIKIPKALLKAISEGRFSDLSEYLRIQNIKNDTEMRKSLSARLQNQDDDEDFDDEE